MDENNKKGPGVFYAVIGVATLVVAIIGATFAYFSASASNTSTITGTTASAGGIDLVVKPITETNSNLIPLNLRLGDKKGVDTTDQFAPAMTGKCKDANGNNVCQVYKIVVSNKSTTSTVQVRGTLSLTSTASNMYWRLIDATTTGTDDAPVFATGTKLDYSTDVLATTTGGVGNLTVGGNTGGTGAAAASKNLGFTDADNSATYYVLVWLEEMGVAQEGNDAAKTFSGEVSFNAVDASGATSGVTASFAGV